MDIANSGTIVTLNVIPAIPACDTAKKDVELSIQKKPIIVTFGENTDAICENQNYLQLAAEILEYLNFAWSTSGDGYFSPSSSLTTKYFPGPNDTTNGSFTLTLYASPKTYCSTGTTASKQVEIIPLPVVFAGDDATIGAGEDFYTGCASAENVSSVSWSSGGDGFFQDADTLHTFYMPGTNDIASGEVLLFLSVAPIEPCSLFTSDTLALGIIFQGGHNAVVNAGCDQSVCFSDLVELNEAQASYYMSLEWATSGNGFFDDPFKLKPVYTPSLEDLTAGTVTLCLTAFADEGFSDSTDCMRVFFYPQASVEIGNDATICACDVFQLNANITDSNGFQWATTGDGSFDNPGILNPVYVPGPGDIQNSGVQICLEVTAYPGCNNVYDCLDLYIQQLPFANAGEDFTTCCGNSFQLLAEADNYSLVEWETSGNGTFDNSDVLQPVYMPDSADWLAGYVFLKMNVKGLYDCGWAEDSVKVSFQQLPVVSAGDDRTICETDSLYLEGFAENYGEVLWLSNGDGVFTQSNSLITTYIPGVQDKIAGSAELCLNAEGLADCQDVGDCLVLHIEKMPQVDVGMDLSICGITQVSLNNASASDYNTLTWATSGDGTFSDIGVLNPIYTPGSNDLAVGVVELCLTASGSNFCSEVFDCLLIHLFPSPYVEAGENPTICSDDIYQMSGQAQNINTFYWTTSGDGFFNDSTVLNPVYTPGLTDIANGNVQISLTGTGLGVCQDVSDSFILTIQHIPYVFAGEDVTVIIDENYSITGATIDFAQEFFWQTNGTGTFSDSSVLNPVYYPSPTDYASGEVILSLTAIPLNPCTLSVVDEFTMHFISGCLDAIADAGEDQTICASSFANVSGNAVNQTGVLWETTGDGTFINSCQPQSVYQPGPEDLNSGSVILKFTAFAFAGCADSTDFMILNFTPVPLVNAGENQIVCETNSIISLSGTAASYTFLKWETTGFGVINNPFSLNTTYELSPLDIQAGNVIFTLTAQNDFCEPETDQVEILIIPKATVFAGSDASVCEGIPFSILDASAENFQQLEWITFGDGFFTEPGQVTTTYYPGNGDIQNGEVQLCLNATASPPCPDVSDCLTLTILPNALVFAGEDQTICETEYAILNATADNYNDLIWKTDGDGVFDQPGNLNTNYLPGALDKINGVVMISAIATSFYGCAPDTSSLTLIIEKSPVAYGGPDVTVCESSDVYLNGNVHHCSSLVWSSSGDGIFSDSAIIDPVYYPGSEDLSNGEVFIEITAFPMSACQSVSDQIKVSFRQLAEVNAGQDTTIFKTDTLITIQASAENYSALLWSTSGTGVFSNPASLHSKYFHSLDDMVNGSVVLTLTAYPIDPCTVAVSDELILTIQYNCLDAIANAGNDQTICSGDELTISGASSFFSQSVLWNSSGDGVFNYPDSLNPIYSPGSEDIINGSVELCLTAFPYEDCAADADCLLLVIVKPPLVFAGEDNTVPLESYTFSDAWAENYSDIQWFTTNGMGSFENEKVVQATYCPSGNDVGMDSIYFQLVAAPVNPCQFSDEDIVVLKFYDGCLDAIADAGEDITVCSTGATAISGVVENDSAVLWQSSGDGFFENASATETIYTPGNEDQVAGEVQLYLTAFAFLNCNDDTDTLQLTLVSPPEVNAGENMTICESNNNVVISSFATGYDSLQWISRGDGFFSIPGSIPSYYTPGPEDYENGGTWLILYAFNDFCPPVSDSLLLIINKNPVIEIEENPQICEGSTYNTQNNVVVNFTGVMWSTTGDGYFENPDQLSTVYFPGEIESSQGIATLCLEAFSLDGCENADTCFSLVILPNASVFAGDNISICETDDALLSGTAENFESVLWQTDGDGYFESSGLLSTVYLPGNQDISDGQVNITLTAFSNNGCGNAMDSLTILIDPLPIVTAGENITVCADEQVNLAGLAINASSVNWSSAGDGYFADVTSTVTDYFPGEDDKAAGVVTLTLHASSSGLCPDASDDLIVIIHPLPTVFAGDDDTICQTSSYTLNGYATNYSNLFWTSDGDGFFDNFSWLNATYTPGNLDKTIGSVNLTLHVAGFAPCPEDEDQLTLSLMPPPLAFPGSDLTICEDGIVELTGNAQNYSTFEWETTGDGVFDNFNSLTTSYAPGPNDISQGLVEICLTATGFELCESSTECLFLTIRHKPVIELTDSLMVCETDIVNLSADVQNYSSVVWNTEGDGQFVENDTTETVYQPGEMDLLNGEVLIYLTVFGNEPCGEETENVFVEFVSTPQISAGNDVIIGKDDSFIPENPSAINCSSILWSTNGSGSFDDPTKLLTVYTPSLEDIVAGTVFFTLTGFSILPCQGVVSDEVQVTIVYDCLDAIADAGENGFVCAGEIYQITGATTSFSTGLYWETDGDGVFDDPTLLEASYYPGSNDLTKGWVTLYLTAFAAGDCNNDTDSMILHIQPPPVAFAGYSNTVPVYIEGGYFISSANAENYTYIQWYTIEGMGLFYNENTENPVYVPSPMDMAFDSISLVMTCSPLSPCLCSSTSYSYVKFVETCQNAVVSLGTELFPLCPGDTSLQLQATGDAFSTIEWTTTGDGSFTGQNTFSPTYFLGQSDKISGEFWIKVFVAGFDSCQSAVDSMFVQMQLPPEVFAGSDLTVCEGEPVSLVEAIAENYVELEWGTLGDGFFVEPYQLNSSYVPGVNDLSNGSVELFLTVTGIPECSLSDSDSLLVTFNQMIILQNIEDMDVMIGEDAIFTIEVINADTYQWYGPSGLLEGEISPTLIITAVDDDDNGQYFCKISNSCSTILSNVAMLRVCHVQELFIPEGWSGISSWIDPFDDDIESIFSEVMDELVLIKNFSGVYCPLLGLSILDTWDSQDGYEVKFTAPVVVNITGQPVSNKTITINSGWNYLSVISACEVPLVIFETFPVEIIKEIGGSGIYWPSLGINTIENLQPGKAYLMRAETQFDFTFPVCDGLKYEYSGNYPPALPQNPWNEINMTSATHVIAFKKSVLEELQPGMIIGAFNADGLCTGLIKVTDKDEVMVIFGDDLFTGISDGMTEDEIIQFRQFNPNTGHSADLEVEYDQNFIHHSGRFALNGLSVVTSLKTQSSQVSLNDAIPLRVFPNPAGSEIFIAGVDKGSFVELYGSGGNLILVDKCNDLEEIGEFRKIILQGLPSGLYYLKVIAEKYTVVRKFIKY
ncbi:MAG TPA: T9SS type A sorting domain-containing protein [Bacteroidales bacterium]|nr:T9SS type A sorting domain-containing protein [Bacteroidales bacterium]